MAETTVTRNDAAGRYEIHVDGALGGYTEFRVDSTGRLLLPHTEIDPAFAGQGLGGTLVGEALADVSARGETIVPLCPFVARYLEKHTVEGLRVEQRRGAGASEAGGSGV